MINGVRAAVTATAMMAAFAGPAEATYIDFDDKVTVDKSNVGFNWVVDFAGKANGSATSKISALGSFTFNGVSNGGKTFNFDYSITNDSIYDSRIRAFGFDTSGTLTAINSTGALDYEYANVTWPENIGKLDICFAAGTGGCTAHSAGGIRSNPDLTGVGTFSLTFAQVMDSISFEHFAVKFLSVNPKVNGQDWGVGMGSVTSMTNGESPVSTAPEPTTWAMMLIGFGLVGLTARRRRSANMLAHRQII